MKQLLILSGKGGTGKTTVAGAFIELLKAEAYADCDVDAPNLHLIAGRDDSPQAKEYYGLPKAHIVEEKCVGCGNCEARCRFSAVRHDAGYHIDPFSCEGCGVCAAVCPSGAIVMKAQAGGELLLYTEGAVFSTAKLKMGGGASGKLVTEVKKQLASAYRGQGLVVIDGSPGIGCPVIASLSGVQMALIVAEPSISGLSDMERIIQTARFFGTPLAVCVNKADTNAAITQKIKEYCAAEGIAYAGSIPYDAEAVRAVNSGATIAHLDSPCGRGVRAVFQKVIEILQNNDIIE